MTFIFVGRSGCGKGTQIELLKKYLEEKNSGCSVVLIETGGRFRSFIAGDSYASDLSKEIMEKGELQPEFLAVLMWSEEMIDKIKGNEHLLIDGAPRRLREAMVLDTALRFFKKEQPIVVHLDVSSEWSKERLRDRGRKDDIGEEEVKKRLAWFDTEVKPAIDWFREEPYYRVVDINGEQTIEEVHRDIVSAIFSF
ncbi:MAG: nucleoside monophosphate kinase [Patescibacteria group bacterium]